MELSKRLFMTASMVDRGSIVADVGCDHGYTAIYLVQNGICPRVLAMDVNEGPLARAKEHIREAGLSAYIETRLSDGLSAMKWVEETGADGGTGADGETLHGEVFRGEALRGETLCGEVLRKSRPEADTLLMAGIGGRLAARILENGAQKLFRMRTVIVQPQSELQLVRRTLNRLGYRIEAEDMVKEDGKFYTAILARNVRMAGSGEDGSSMADAVDIPAVPQGLSLSEEVWREAGERYGYPLIADCHPVLLEYLEDSLQKKHAARAAILAGVGIHAGARGAKGAGASDGMPAGTQEESLEKGGMDSIPVRSRERLMQLEREALLEERLAAWMRTRS